MFKRMKVVLLVICLMLFLVMTGCSGSKEPKETEETGNTGQGNFTGSKDNDKEKAEPVKLKWVFMSPGEQKDSQEVWDKFNEELQKYLPGTTVEFEGITSADYAEKWKLISASQENVDIVWNGWMINYVTEEIVTIDESLISSDDNIYKNIDINTLINYVNKLKRYVSERGKILPRRMSGVCARHQRELTSAVKRAREIALLPFSKD